MDSMKEPSYLLEIDGVAKEKAPMVYSFSGRERISGIFEYELELLAQTSDLTAPDALNKKAVFTIKYRETKNGRPEDKEVKKYGIISEFVQRGATPHYFSYYVKLVPRMWRLNLIVRNDIYQNMKIKEIVEKVLSDSELSSGIDFEFDINQGDYADLEYVVQYRESDFQFVNHRLEHFGISYFFDHSSGIDKIVFTDQNAGFLTLPLSKDLSYNAQKHHEDIEPRALEFTCRSKVDIGKTILKEWNYRTPNKQLLAQAQSKNQADAPGFYYQFGDHFRDDSQGQLLADRRMEEIDCRRNIFHGKSDCRLLQAGGAFKLTHDKMKSWDGKKYLITSLTSSGNQRGFFPKLQKVESPESPFYENQFEAIDADVAFRPARVTPKSKLEGVLSAVTQAPQGEEYAHLDDRGRYRLKMPFDLSDRENDEASQLVRMTAPHSGPGYGMHFPQHAGVEVAWASLDGDPDRPIALGSLPNEATVTPVTQSNKSQHMILTSADNLMQMEDQKGKERVTLVSPWANSILSLGSPFKLVEGVTVTTERVTALHGKEGVYITAWGTVGDKGQLASEVSKALAAAGFAVSAGAALGAGSFGALGAITGFLGSVAGWMSPSVIITAPAGVSLVTPNTISALAAAGIGLFTAAGVDLAAGAGILQTAGTGIHHFTATGGIKNIARAGDLFFHAVAGNMQSLIHQNIDIESEQGDMSVKVDKGNLDVVAKKTITIMAEDDGLQITAQKDSVVITAKKNISLKCGKATLTLNDNGDIMINGAKISIKGSGDVVIKGSKIAEN